MSLVGINSCYERSTQAKPFRAGVNNPLGLVLTLKINRRSSLMFECVDGFYVIVWFQLTLQTLKARSNVLHTRHVKCFIYYTFLTHSDLFNARIST